MDKVMIENFFIMDEFQLTFRNQKGGEVKYPKAVKENFSTYLPGFLNQTTF
jgi:hypothetical protein